VKLVARLFNLEKYGERLVKAVNERYFAAEEEVNLITAKMEENEGGDEQLFQTTQAEIAAEKELLQQAKLRLDEAERVAQRYAEQQKAKLAFDKISARLSLLQTRLAEMQTLRALLEKYPKAQAIKEKVVERDTSLGQKKLAKQRAELAKAAREAAIEKERRWKAYLEENTFDEKILRASLQLQKIQDAAQDRAHAERLQKEYAACVAQYRALKDKCAVEDFARQRETLDKELSALGEDATLLDYLKKNYKNVLLADSYGEFRLDLLSLSKKYPEIETDVQSLLQKYTLPSTGETRLDILSVNLAFKEQEQRRKRLQAEIDALENRRQAYLQNEQEKKLLEKQGTLLKQNLQLAIEKIADLQDLGTEKELVAKIDGLKKEQASAQTSLENAQKAGNSHNAEMQTQEKLFSLYEERISSLQTSLQTLLQENGFQSEAQALALTDSVGDYENSQKKCAAFFEEYDLCRRQYETTDTAQFQGYTESALDASLSAVRLAKETYEALTRSLNFKEAKLERLLALRERYQALEKQLTEKRKALQTCDELRQLLRGNKFLEFIAAEYLQEVCLLASKTLLSLTGGRYFLQYDKEFKVGDNRDGGNLRAVKTLSGGETFLVSLSLALSLSASICQKSRRPIEFFFLDEGFGTLDEKLVETVMDVLGKLSKSFSVGLISHVEELKRRIENKILVTGATESKGSTLKIEAF